MQQNKHIFLIEKLKRNTKREDFFFLVHMHYYSKIII